MCLIWLLAFGKWIFSMVVLREAFLAITAGLMLTGSRWMVIGFILSMSMRRGSLSGPRMVKMRWRRYRLVSRLVTLKRNSRIFGLSIVVGHN